MLLLLTSCEREVSRSIPISPEPIGSKLSISSNPNGATIYLDGKTTGIYTPDSLTWLEIKEYKVTLKKDLYLDTTFFVDVLPDSNKSLMIDYTTNPKMYGSLKCQSTPDDAEIFLNGKFTGKYTPTVIDSLLPGNYTVEYYVPGARRDSMMTTVSSRKISLALLNLVDTTLWVDYNIKTSGIFGFAYTKIAISEDDIIWLSSLSNGLTKYDGKNWINFTTENSGLSSNSINEMKLSPQGDLWICTNKGVNKFDGTNWTVFNEEQNNIPSDLITDIAFDIDGSILISTHKGLAHFQNNLWESFTFDIIIPTSKESLNYFTSVDIDNNGHWWGTKQQNGISHWNGIKWIHYFSYVDTEEDPIDRDIHYKLVRHSDNEIWFAHTVNVLNGRTLALSSYSNNQFDKSTYGQFTGTNINSIKIRNGNEKWISSSIGLYRFVDYNNRIKYSKSNTSLVTDIIQDIAFDSKGDAWVVTMFDGIYHFKLSQL